MPAKPDVLFIHQNFPAQYRHLAAALAQRGHRVVALATRNYTLPGVTVVPYKYLRGVSDKIHPLVREQEVKVIRGEAVAAACNDLKSKGLAPAVVYVHPGWGEALFLRDVFPQAKIVVYCEFFYRLEGQDVNFDPEFPRMNFKGQCVLRMKNTCNLHVLEIGDAFVSPTQWQRSTYPASVQERILALHDGIDTAAARPDPAAEVILEGGLRLTRKDQVVTYVARNFEPMRGTHIFLRALPEMLAQLPEAHVLVIGSDGVSYGPAHESGRSWREVVMDDLDTRDFDRVHFMGRVEYGDFLSVLQISSAHVYLTYPFVLSWSMLEAVACGAHVVGSDTGPVREVLPESQRVDFFDVDGLAQKVVEAVRSHDPQAAVEVPDCMDELSLDHCLPRHLQLFDELSG